MERVLNNLDRDQAAADPDQPGRGPTGDRGLPPSQAIERAVFLQGTARFGGRIEPGLRPATRARSHARADISPKRRFSHAYSPQ